MLTFRGVRPPAAVRWTGAGPTSLLYFAVIESTLMSAKLFTLASTAVLAIVVFALWRVPTGPFWTMLDITLFGPVTFPVVICVTIFVTRPVAVFIPVLCGPWFLFPFQTAPDMPPPYGAAVSSGGGAVRVTVGKDGFLIKDCPIPSALTSGGGIPSAVDTTLAQVDGTSGGKSGGRSGACGGFKTPNSFNWATSLAVNNSRSPGRPGKIVSTAQKGPMVRNRTSCRAVKSTSGPTWLCGMTISGNSLGPNCTPLRIRRWPSLVCFLSVGSQFGKDNNLLTIMLLVTMAYAWFKGSQGIILEGSLFW